MVLRKFLAYFLLVTLSISSIAMPVFTHVCNGMDKTWSSLFVPPANCCDKAGNATKTCKPVSNTREDSTFSKLPCCEDDVSLAALGANYTVQSTSSLSLLPTTPLPVPYFYPDLSGYSVQSIYQVITRDQLPTPRYGRSLLIFEQLFLC